jgi:hypothetical protein
VLYLRFSSTTVRAKIKYTGKNEFEKYAHKAKQNIFGINNVISADIENDGKTPKTERLLIEFNNWFNDIEDLNVFMAAPDFYTNHKSWKHISLVAVQRIK